MKLFGSEYYIKSWREMTRGNEVIQNPEIETSTALGLGLAALGYFVFWGLVLVALVKFVFF